MLDTFEIITTSGVVIWSKSFATVSPNVVNSLITDIFIEERGGPGGGVVDDVSAARTPVYKKDQYTLKWTTWKDLGLIFVNTEPFAHLELIHAMKAVYQSLLHLSWIDKLLDNVKAIFVDLYKDQLRKPHTSVVETNFEDYFDQQVKELENAPGGRSASYSETNHLDELTPPSSSDGVTDVPPPLPGQITSLPKSLQQDFSVVSSTDATPVPTPDTSRPSTPIFNNHLVTATKSGPGPKGSRRARKAAAQSANSSAHASSGEEATSRKMRSAKSTAKRMRKWDDSGLADDGPDMPLDYSASAEASTVADLEGQRPGAMEAVKQEAWGTMTSKGQFVLKGIDEDRVNSILSSTTTQERAAQNSTGIFNSSLGAIGGLFRNVVGGKILTKDDLAKPMKGMLDHLVEKNVAQEAAMRLCDGVERELIGVKTGSFQSVESKVRTAMESSLRKILTPTSSIDLLREIESITSPSALSLQKRRPYVISIVGVNGVGKSTNLSKICFFLLQNKYRVLIAACDTFRSGAVEQLKVHTRNLKELGEREGGYVELYQKGYGKDAANVAKDAVAYAATSPEAFDVVLIDTAGRRHNDERLMSSLEKFGKFARPDKILMVGEALVGSDSVQQARNFNDAFGPGRNLDGFIISKCDTVGSMVGTLVSMVHATGIPVLFLGVGQHYSDLRNLNIPWAVNLLMS